MPTMQAGRTSLRPKVGREGQAQSIPNLIGSRMFRPSSSQRNGQAQEFKAVLSTLFDRREGYQDAPFDSIDCESIIRVEIWYGII